MSTGTISATLVRHPRRNWTCDSCGAPMGMAKHVRLYGSSDGGENPYTIRICLFCADRCAGAEAKVKAAMAPISGYKEPPPSAPAMRRGEWTEVEP